MIYGLVSKHLSDPILWTVARYSVVRISQLRETNRCLHVNRTTLIKKLITKPNYYDVLGVMTYMDERYRDMLKHLLYVWPNGMDVANVIVLIDLISNSMGPHSFVSLFVDHLLERARYTHVCQPANLGYLLVRLSRQDVSRQHAKELLRYYETSASPTVIYKFGMSSRVQDGTSNIRSLINECIEEGKYRSLRRVDIIEYC